jgi:ADP-ribose pyrophosphatase
VIEMREKMLSSRNIYQGMILDLTVDEVLLPSGRKTTREVVKHNGAVGLIPVLGDGRIVLTEQYRYATGETLIEIPAGRLEPGESPDETARRELAEETGFEADEIRNVLTFYTAPGYTSEKLYLYVARELRSVESKPDLDEDIHLMEVSLAEAVRLIEKGEIKDGKTVAALLYYKTFLASR